MYDPFLKNAHCGSKNNGYVFNSSIEVANYCWWKKSCTTWDVYNLVNTGINYQPQLVQDFWTINSTDGDGINLVSSMGQVTIQGLLVYLLWNPQKHAGMSAKKNARFAYGPSRPKQQRFVWYLNRIFHHDWPGPNSFIMKKLRFYNEYTWYDSLFCRELFHEQWKHPGFSLGQDINASFGFENVEIASKKVQPSIGCFCWLHGGPGSAWCRQWVLDVFLHGVCCKWVASLP